MRSQVSVFPAAFSAILLFAAAAYGAPAAANEKKLQEYKKKIVESRDSLDSLARDIEYKKRKKDELEKKETVTTEKLETVTKKITDLETAIDKTSVQLSGIQKRYQSTQSELQAVQVREAKLKALLRSELRFVYKKGIWNTSGWDFWTKEILFAGDMSSFLKRYSQLKLLIKQKTEIFMQTLEVEERILGLKNAISGQRNETKRLLKKQKVQDAQLLSVKEREKAVLERVRREKQNYEREIEKLKETEQEVSRLIDLYSEKTTEAERALKLQKQASAREPRLKSPVSFIMPVSGEVVTKFGKQKHPEFDTYRIVNGIEIKGSYGEEVNAMSDGKVLFCNLFKSYGKTVILDHGSGFFSVYAYLKDISVTETEAVKRGQVIGTMGYSHLGREPRLYLEIRRNGRPEDPLIWLKK